jgi:N-acetylneuraminic acid mutarotase
LAGNTTAALVGSKVYLFGGFTYVGGKGAYVNTINVFDIENNTVEKLSTTLPSVSEGIAAAAFGTKIYLFGGVGNFSACYASINVFDTESDAIETLNTMIPMKASEIASAVVGTKAYLFGGYDGTNTLATINVFTALMPLATNNMLIEASATKNRFNLLPNVELGVNNVYLGNADGNGERVDAYLHNGTEWVEV